MSKKKILSVNQETALVVSKITEKHASFVTDIVILIVFVKDTIKLTFISTLYENLSFNFKYIALL